MSLKARVTEDMKSAMRAREADRLTTIRMLLAAVKQREVDERIELSDADLVAIVEKMIKQRRDSIAQFSAGGRPELAAKEQQEIDLLQTYLPQRLGDHEIDQAIEQAIARAGVTGAAAMGKVMGALKSEFAGRADMAQVSAKVKARLAT